MDTFNAKTYSSTAFKMSSLNSTSVALNPNDVASTIVSEHRDVIEKMSTLSFASSFVKLSIIWSAHSLNVEAKL